MTRQIVGASLIGAGVGIIVGGFLAWAEATYSAEHRAKDRYEEQLETHKRVLQRAHEQALRSRMAEAPVDTEGELEIKLSGDDLPLPDADDTIKVGGEMVIETPLPPDYVGTAAMYADPGTFIADGKVLSLEYIEAEDYEEEDGRAKEQITIFMGDEPIFVMDGESIENWAELIGDHILVDFYQKIPPGEQDRVLYVRNHRRDEDYEVWQSMP